MPTTHVYFVYVRKQWYFYVEVTGRKNELQGVREVMCKKKGVSSVICTAESSHINNIIKMHRCAKNGQKNVCQRSNIFS